MIVRKLRPALFVLGLALTGCSLASPAQTVVREEIAGHSLLVQLETAPPSTAQGGARSFAHPVAGDEQELAARIDPLLGELAYGRPRGQRLTRALAVDDRLRLAAALAKGLVQAGSSQRVRFLLSVEDNAHTPWITPEDRLTRGVAFIDLDGRFNVIFDLLDDRIDPRELDAHDPTERAQTRARLVSETGEDLGRSDDGSRRLWVAWQLFANERAPSLEPLANPDAAKLELLDELLRDGVIDRAEYERRRARLRQP